MVPLELDALDSSARRVAGASLHLFPLLSMLSRKAARRQARVLKSQRKDENYRRIREMKQRAKDQVWEPKNNRTTNVKKFPSPKSATVKPQKSAPSRNSNETKTRSLLDLAEEAIDKGILRSDGEFEESEMDALWRAESEDLEKSQPPSQDSTEEVRALDYQGVDPKPEDTSSSVSLRPRTLSFRRQQGEGTADEGGEVERTTHGLLNRLSQSNCESVVNAFASLCQKNPRSVVFEVIILTIVDFFRHQPNMLDVFVLNYALLVSSLGHLVSSDLVGSVLEHCVHAIDELKGRNLADSSSDVKVLLNLVTFVGYLYDLQATSCKLVVDILNESANLLSEVDVEAILRLIRIAGAQMRSEDPDSLKQVLTRVSTAASLIPETHKSTRFKFMLDAIQDLKHNRQKLLAVQRGELESAKKIQRHILQKNNLTKLEPLQVELDDLRNASSKGRWWKIGAAWSPPDSETVDRMKTQVNADSSNALLLKARKLKMNTELRRAIFMTLMSSEDYLDAYQRLVALKLSSRQEREILHVLLHCCIRERVFNPFYALVASKFLGSRHNFVVTTKYALWDRLKQIEEGAKPREIIHTAKFFGLLLGKRAIGLEMLKRVSFMHLTEATMLLAKVLFATAFKLARDDTSICVAFSELNDRIRADRPIDADAGWDGDTARAEREEDERDRILRAQELDVLKTGLRMFLTEVFQRQDLQEFESESCRDLIMKRASLAAHCLK